MNEDKLKEYISSKCYELSNLKVNYEYYKNKVIGCCNDLEAGSTFWVEGIASQAEQMNKYYNQYNQGYRDIRQLCYVLGGDYLETFKRLLESEA